MPKPALQFTPARADVLQIDLDRPHARLSPRALAGIKFLFPNLLGENHVQIKMPTLQKRRNTASKRMQRKRTSSLLSLLRSNVPGIGHGKKSASISRDFKPQITRWPSRSGNTHIEIQLSRRINVCERIFLQAILGSDPWREMRNWLRAKRGSPHPILFFERGKK